MGILPICAPIKAGAYLATVIDLFNTEIIGWRVDKHMRTSLVIDALRMARDHGRLHPDGAVFQPDRGAQYTSKDFQAWCGTNHVTQSMGAVGTCWDCQDGCARFCKNWVVQADAA